MVGPAPAITAEQTQWACIYPVYLNSKKKRSEGRRIAVEKACENPTLSEIVMVCESLGLQTFVEPNKAYPRDYMLRGRIRIQLKVDKVPVHETIQSKHQLLLALGDKVPKLASRNKKAAPVKGKGKKGKKGKN